MRTLVLRKSVGPFSAGTRVIQPGKDAVRPKDFPPGFTVVVKGKYYKEIKHEGNLKLVEVEHEVVVPPDDLVELRNATSEYPAVPRINRPDRVARRILWRKLNGIEGVI